MSRLVNSLLGLLLIASLVFFLMHAVPGGPFASEKKLPPEIIKNLNAKYHLDQPLWKQYTDYMGNLLHGDLGPSFKYPDRTVNELILQGFPISAILGMAAIFIAVTVGCTLGIFAAINHNRWQDFLAVSLAVLNYSIPGFVMAPLLIYVFSLKLGWFPPAMWGTAKHLVLPTLALAAGPMAFIAVLMRSSMLDVLRQDYIRTAVAKGFSQRAVIYRHGLKNALIPVVAYLGPLTAGILTGSFVIEKVFAIPGLGDHFVTGIINRDYTVVMGVTLFYSAILLGINFIIDIVFVLIDPRISLTGSARLNR
ncbi:ABC transporter permease [Phosphitispora sp. TUW77]|uniref:ABC transporter permease n=1 Tax=Phosphitispora sp. TUW77 TaxID=3152361 RepID=UPI003AB49647